MKTNNLFEVIEKKKAYGEFTHDIYYKGKLFCDLAYIHNGILHYDKESGEPGRIPFKEVLAFEIKDFPDNFCIENDDEEWASFKSLPLYSILKSKGALTFNFIGLEDEYVKDHVSADMVQRLAKKKIKKYRNLKMKFYNAGEIEITFVYKGKGKIENGFKAAMKAVTPFYDEVFKTAEVMNKEIEAFWKKFEKKYGRGIKLFY